MQQLFLLLLPFVICNDVLPTLPLQFSADIEITAHLVDRTQDYPPWLRKIRLNYDFVKKLARAEILQGYDQGKIYIRRYDQVMKFSTVLIG